MKKHVFALTLCAAALALPSVSYAQTARVESCSAQVDTYSFNSSDKDFKAAAERVNRNFSAARTGVVSKGAPLGPVVPAGTKTLKIKAEMISCSDRKNAVRAPQTDFSASSCNYVGCVESLGPDYSDMPAGSTVSISTCSGNVSTTRTYTKSSSGNWVMMSYQTEYVTHCDPTG